MRIYVVIFFSVLLLSCESDYNEMKKIIFLHHSTGYNIWLGKTNRYIYKLTGNGDVTKYFNKYNRKHKTDYKITSLNFPKKISYGWKNYPFDYYNIWVKNAGSKLFMEEPTLEILTREYDVIIFKHCYPGSNIQEDSGLADINSERKSLENYKLQYTALKQKMHEFPANKFIVWTPAVNTKNRMTKDEAERTRAFYNWILNEWDEKGDNIYIWDFYRYETDGSLYLLDNNALNPDNSHPNSDFSGRVAPLFAKYIIDVIESKAE